MSQNGIKEMKGKMSVMDKRSDIEQIADALYYDAMGQRHFVYAVIPKVNAFSASVDDYKEPVIDWCNRLYMANQCAYILTYSHNDDCDKTINLLERNEALWAHGGHLLQDLPRFFRILESIRYNLYSNGGQVMLCGEDMARLNDLMAGIAREIVGMYQKEIGKVMS
jgi:hypothetical protein